MHTQGHVVQFFDTPNSRADAVSSFLRDGLFADDAVILVLTGPHWELVRRRCREDGLDVDAACAAGRLRVRDADTLLTELMAFDELHWPTFEAMVQPLLRQAEAKGAGVRIYGEMVDRLARTGEFEAAQRLEEFWNRLQARQSFTLFCGYSAEHFGNPRDREALRRVCQQHSLVQSDPRDVLGNFLLKSHSAC